VNPRASSDFKPGNLAAIEQEIINRVEVAVTESSVAVMDAAKILVPVDTGELRSSIAMQVELKGKIVVGTIYAGANHAAFVEYGTGLVGAAAPHPPLPTEGVPITGSWIYDYKGQGWIGMAARPFLRPAYDASKNFILAAFRRQGFKV
jgi:HK97 gp10 family phage protein